MVLTIMAYLVAILLSFAAGLISIVGMAAIFSGAYTVTLIVMSLFEVAKVVVATWLHRHWNDLNRRFRFFFSLAVLILMAFTSLGIYGFFTRAHIVQQVALSSGEVTKIPGLQAEVSALEQQRDLIQGQLALDTKAVDSLISTSKKSKEAKEALKASNAQKGERAKLSAELSQVLTKLGEKNAEIIRIEGKQRELEVEIGPLKYLAKFIYGREPTVDEGEHVVTWLIFAIMLVFDPLALTLLMASNSVLDRKKVPEPEKEPEKVPETAFKPEPIPPEDVFMHVPRKVGRRKYRRKRKYRDNVIPVAPFDPKKRKKPVLDLTNFKP